MIQLSAIMDILFVCMTSEVPNQNQMMTQEVRELGQWVEAEGREIRFPGIVKLTTWFLWLILDMMVHLSIFDILTLYIERHHFISGFISSQSCANISFCSLITESAN